MQKIRITDQLQACFIYRIAARQTQIATEDEQRTVRIGECASAGFCGGNAGKAAVMGAAKCDRVACDRSRCFSGEEIIALSPSAPYCIRLPTVRRTWSNSAQCPESRAFPPIQDDRHEPSLSSPSMLE